MTRGARPVLQLYILERAPRSMPPWTELPEGLSRLALARVVRRAAWHPWRDATFWREAAQRAESRPTEALAGRHLAQLCLAFRHIGFASPVLAAYCERYFKEQRQGLNTFELAAVLTYFAGVCARAPGAEAFVEHLADEVCSDWRKREVVPWSAWRMLVVAAAESGVAHRGLFETASTHLAKSARLMSGRDAVDICSAYAAFRFKHHSLLGEVGHFLPSMDLTDSEVWALQTALARLDFEAPLLHHRLRELRGLASEPALS